MAKTPQTTETDAPKVKKGAVCTKVYIDDKDGSESRSAKPTSKVLEFRFHDGPKGEIGTVRKVSLGDNPGPIEMCLHWFGRSEKYGNFYAGAKGDAATAVEMFDTGAEILAGGEWSERKEGVGTRPSYILAAVVAFLESKGETVDEARKGRIKEKVSTTEGRKGARANPEIEVEYQKIIQAHQAEKTKAAINAAKDVETDLGGF